MSTINDIIKQVHKDTFIKICFLNTYRFRSAREAEQLEDQAKAKGIN